MRFFVFYIAWPLTAGILLVSLLVTKPDWALVVAVGWMLLWAVPPISTLRKNHLESMVEDPATAGLGSILGIPLLMFLSLYAGLALAPPLLEGFFGIDVDAKLKEISERVETSQRSQNGRSKHSDSSALPGAAGFRRS